MAGGEDRSAAVHAWAQSVLVDATVTGAERLPGRASPHGYLVRVADDETEYRAHLAADALVGPVPPLPLATQVAARRLIAQHSPTATAPVIAYEPTAAGLDGGAFLEAVPAGQWLVADGAVAPWYPALSWTERRAIDDDVVWALAGLHLVDLTNADAGDVAAAGSAGLNAELDRWRARLAQVHAAPARTSLLAAAWSWIEEHRPADPGPDRLLWGNADVANVIVGDGGTAVTLVDFSSVRVGPPGIDLGDLAISASRAGMGADAFAIDEIAETYEFRTAFTLGDRPFWLAFAALRSVLRSQMFGAPSGGIDEVLAQFVRP